MTSSSHSDSSFSIEDGKISIRLLKDDLKDLSVSRHVSPREALKLL